MSIKDTTPKFSTSNFYLASFLMVKGMTLTGLDKTNPKRCEFIFEDVPARLQLSDAFAFANENDQVLLVDARRMIAAIKNLKEKLYEDR